VTRTTACASRSTVPPVIAIYGADDETPLESLDRIAARLSNSSDREATEWFSDCWRRCGTLDRGGVDDVSRLTQLHLRIRGKVYHGGQDGVLAGDTDRDVDMLNEDLCAFPTDTEPDAAVLFIGPAVAG